MDAGSITAALCSSYKNEEIKEIKIKITAGNTPAWTTTKSHKIELKTFHWVKTKHLLFAILNGKHWLVKVSIITLSTLHWFQGPLSHQDSSSKRTVDSGQRLSFFPHPGTQKYFCTDLGQFDIWPNTPFQPNHFLYHLLPQTLQYRFWRGKLEHSFLHLKNFSLFNTLLSKLWKKKNRFLCLGPGLI